jgi:hypothetical protein
MDTSLSLVPLNRRSAVAVVLGTCCLVAPELVSRFARGEPWTTDVILFESLMLAMVVAALGLGLRWGHQRKFSTRRTLIVAYLLAMLLGAGSSALFYVLSKARGTVNPDVSSVLEAAADGGSAGLAVLGVWALFFFTPQAVADARQRERAQQELRREIERSRVRSTLEPHFVLNTLNAIASLTADSPELARNLIGDLGDLLRDAVKLAERTSHCAADEIQRLQRYTRIFEARYPGRIVFSWQIDRQAVSRQIPVLLLQPLVENAIQHGALSQPGSSRVNVCISLEQDSLRCEVSDEGQGFAQSSASDGGHGLDLTNRRLACDAPGSKLVFESTAQGTRAVVLLCEPTSA